MTFLHSIRWRLQLWHGVLLALVLAGYGVTAWRLDRAARLQRVDQELERRVGGIVNALRPTEPPPGGRERAPDRPAPPREGGQSPRPERPAGRVDDRPAPRGELRLGRRDAEAFQGGPAAGYYVVWDRGGVEIARSAAAPENVPRPEPGGERRQARSRQALREYVHVAGDGESILVGRDIRDEWEELRRFAWVLAGAGLCVFAAGLAGGWLVSSRALRPIHDITAAAATISTGALTRRVPVPLDGNELAGLSRVLNDTFARLQASFDRQAQFTADASHELRTPVAVVLTQTQSALARDRSAAEYREALAACQRSAQRMRRLLESLLELARLDSAKGGSARRLPFDLDVLAAGVVDQLRHEASQREASVVLDTSPTPCTGDPEQVERLVLNLVANAIQYNRPGGTVTVHCGVEERLAVLSVQDTGVGIPAKDLPHVFERFYRADESRSGTDRAGLGLAIVRAIVDAHGGTIEAASAPGRGSTFTVRLPGRGNAAGRPSRSSPAPQH
jgi:two-component system, OmpR family, sensor kinase